MDNEGIKQNTETVGEQAGLSVEKTEQQEPQPKVIFGFSVTWLDNGAFQYKFSEGITGDLDLLAKIQLTEQCLAGKILAEQSYIPKVTEEAAKP